NSNLSVGVADHFGVAALEFFSGNHFAFYPERRLIDAQYRCDQRSGEHGNLAGLAGGSYKIQFGNPDVPPTSFLAYHCLENSLLTHLLSYSLRCSAQWHTVCFNTPLPAGNATSRCTQRPFKAYCASGTPSASAEKVTTSS